MVYKAISKWVLGIKYSNTNSVTSVNHQQCSLTFHTTVPNQPLWPPVSQGHSHHHCQSPSTNKPRVHPITQLFVPWIASITWFLRLDAPSGITVIWQFDSKFTEDSSYSFPQKNHTTFPQAVNKFFFYLPHPPLYQWGGLFTLLIMCVILTGLRCISFLSWFGFP